MPRRDERRPDSGGAPRPNVLAEGNPVPNVLHGFAPPHVPGTPIHRPGRADQAAQRAKPKPARRPADAPSGDRRRAPGCGCGGWLGFLVLLGLATRLVGACDESFAPEASSPSATASATAASIMVDARLLNRGDCLRWPEGPGGATVVDRVDCSLAHNAEVTGRTKLPDPPGTPFDDQAVQAAAEVGCNGVYTDYTGEPAVMSTGRHSSFIYPGAEGWKRDDRAVTCLVEGDIPGSLVGSTRKGGAP
jgi:hypothetical protein